MKVQIYCHIWNNHEKCIQISTIQPSIGFIIIEIARGILRIDFCPLKPAVGVLSIDELSECVDTWMWHYLCCVCETARFMSVFWSFFVYHLIVESNATVRLRTQSLYLLEHFEKQWDFVKKKKNLPKTGNLKHLICLRNVDL